MIICRNYIYSFICKDCIVLDFNQTKNKNHCSFQNSKYINIISNLERSEMVEGKFNFEILDSSGTMEENDDNEDEINF